MAKRPRDDEEASREIFEIDSSSGEDDLVDSPPSSKKARVAVNEADSLLCQLPLEMRAHIGSFLEPVPLAALSQTCKSFTQQLKQCQNGPLYYPSHWRKHLASMEGRSFLLRRDFRAAARAFLLKKAQLHIFDGLLGAQAKLTLFVTTSISTGFTAIVGATCKFVYKNRIWTDLPTAGNIAAMKEATRKKHKEQLKQNKRNRSIPLALREERKQLKEEVSSVTKSMRMLVQAMRRFNMQNTDSLSSQIFTAQSFVTHGKRLSELEEQLDELNDRINDEMDAHEEEEKEKIEKENK
jgi:hypothetical protein